MRIKFFIITTLFITTVLFTGTPVSSQTTDMSSVDISKIQVDQLSDDQIKAFVKKAEQSGMSEQELQTAALAKGMAPTEVEKLRTRINNLGLNPDKTTSTGKTSSSRSRTYKNATLKGDMYPDTQSSTSNDTVSDATVTNSQMTGPEANIYGFSLFNSKKLSFAPNLNMPTPKNYVIGPGDEIIIDIWGASQQTYQEKVSPDGSLQISGLGPVFVNGMTFDEASGKLKNELSKIYSGLRGASPNTFIKVTMGSTVRSIKVTIVGDAYLPGTYTLPSLASVFNALYYAKGPSINGSLRNVKVIRDNKTIAELDFYSFMLKGEQPSNLRLEDQDVIYISPYTNRVSIQGEVKRPLMFDMKPTETLKDLISFAGGYTDKSYSEHFKVYRKTTKEIKVVDVSIEQMDTFKLVNGDEVFVSTILDRFANKVEIKGAVYRPGIFAVDEVKSLKKLIEMADGLRGDAFKYRASIYRTREDLTSEVIPVDLSDLLSNNGKDVDLLREDVVFIPSIFDLQETYTISILGEISKPGDYPFTYNATVEDLIVKAGGLLEPASLARIEIARRIKDNMATTSTDKISEIYQFPIGQNLQLDNKASKFVLQPFDRVYVRRSPGYHSQVQIQIEGEVAFPGVYAMANKSERVSDLVNRAGGFIPTAYLKGARLFRQLPSDEKLRLKMLQNLRKQGADSLSVESTSDNEATLAINLDKIIENPKTDMDVFLEEGDRLVVPKILQSVRLTGAVLYPTLVRFDNSLTVKNYISMSGGFAENAIRKNTYVMYPNGAIKQTKAFLWMKFYPKVTPGSEVIVPKKVEGPKLSASEKASIASALVSAALVVVTIINAIF